MPTALICANILAGWRGQAGLLIGDLAPTIVGACGMGLAARCPQIVPGMVPGNHAGNPPIQQNKK